MKLTSLLILSTVFLTSCASYFKRKDCEKTNWHQHGHKVAMQGKRLDQDSFINECRQVEANINEGDLDIGFKSGMANYCKPQAAYDTGRRGEFFNSDMCDYHKLKHLKTKHAQGVNDFCQPNSGFTFGASGKVYNNICPKGLEPAFLTKYNRGRRKYLKGEIQQTRDDVYALDRKISRKQQERSELTFRLNSLPSGKTYERQRVYDPATRTYRESTKAVEDPRVVRQRSDINSRISNVNYEIRNLQKEQDTLNDKLRNLRVELRKFEE